MSHWLNLTFLSPPTGFRNPNIKRMTELGINMMKHWWTLRYSVTWQWQIPRKKSMISHLEISSSPDACHESRSVIIENHFEDFWKIRGFNQFNPWRSPTQLPSVGSGTGNVCTGKWGQLPQVAWFARVVWGGNLRETKFFTSNYKYIWTFPVNSPWNRSKSWLGVHVKPFVHLQLWWANSAKSFL